MRAGYVSRGTASTAVPYSPETIGRHERGDVGLEPMDAVVYADCYQDPALMYRYCSDCPVGQRIGRTATSRTLPFATLRVRPYLSGFADRSSVADWARDGLSWAVGEGLIAGRSSGVLDPQGLTTRAELAQIVMRFAEG